MKDKYTEKLARYIIILLTLAIVGTICWYLRNIIGYLVLAAVVSLLASPLCRLLHRISIKGHKCPMWLAAILSIISVFCVVAGVIMTAVPLVRDVASDISTANMDNMIQSVSVPLASFNRWIVDIFPRVGRDFKIESIVLKELQSMFNVGTVSTMVGSVTTFIAKLGVGIFAVVFISFFFLKSPGLASSIVSAFVPDRYDARAKESMQKTGVLVTRYFIGLVIEVMGVALVNFLGLLCIARMGFKYSLGIAFMTGILNIIPYIGPLMGGVLGVSISLVIHYACVTPFGISVSLLPFILILAAIFTVTQLIDNYVFQPLIYSNSVNIHPLEIFIVFLIAGQIGGMAGMFAAIPAYTVIREVARQFFGDVKAIRMLTSDKE